MGQFYAEQSFLASLPVEFRREVEASAACIIHRIAPATPDRLESLAALAAEEGLRASTQREAQTAYALSAELKRRARLLRH